MEEARKRWLTFIIPNALASAQVGNEINAEDFSTRLPPTGVCLLHHVRWVTSATARTSMSQEKYKIMTEKLEDRIRSLVVNFSRGFVDWACKNVQFE
ncbi:hypothetical protein RRG08_054068 [Elysia crispata]|uniref:Uncharacterized protein n=1 Tax=Elysia crispata TaxID=231223 RepID=A0AAE0ZD60_9GAST|nr:hypothetical protein RRG08_054068 [Elysia crispata]